MLVRSCHHLRQMTSRKIQTGVNVSQRNMASSSWQPARHLLPGDVIKLPADFREDGRLPFSMFLLSRLAMQNPAYEIEKPLQRLGTVLRLANEVEMDTSCEVDYLKILKSHQQERRLAELADSEVEVFDSYPEGDYQEACEAKPDTLQICDPDDPEYVLTINFSDLTFNREMNDWGCQTRDEFSYSEEPFLVS